VVGADYEPYNLPIHVRFSKAISHFYRIKGGDTAGNQAAAAYIAQLADIIREKAVDLWIDCGNTVSATVNAQARRVIEHQTRTTCFVLGMTDARHFEDRNEFLRFTAGLGLPVPEIHPVTSRDEIHRVLNGAQGQERYLLRAPDETAETWLATKFPRRTVSQTYREVSRIEISKSMPWRLEQNVERMTKYTTFSIIVNGSVKAFVANSLSESDGYQALDSASVMNQALLRFVRDLASRQGNGFSMHLNIDFGVDERVAETGVERNILLIGGYLSSLTPSPNGMYREKGRLHSECRYDWDQDVSMPSPRSTGIYCFGQDLHQRVLSPVKQLLTFRIGLIQCLKDIITFVNHAIFWHDDVCDFTNPVPFWWSYQIYCPCGWWWLCSSDRKEDDGRLGPLHP